MKTTIATAASAIAARVAIRRQAVRHAPDRLRDHATGNQLQAVENSPPRGAGEGRRAEREGEQNDAPTAS
jgi:hypothetical protein